MSPCSSVVPSSGSHGPSYPRDGVRDFNTCAPRKSACLARAYLSENSPSTRRILWGRFEGTLSLPQLVKTERVAYADEPFRSGMRQPQPKVEIDLL
jgi:hypothetical protein